MSSLVHQVNPVITGAATLYAGPQTGRFAYDGLEPGDIAIVVAAAEAVRNTQNRTISEIGRHLSRAKAVLPHGRFEAWAEDELGFSSRTARNYMQAAQWLEDKSEILSDLPSTIIYALASPTAPHFLVLVAPPGVEASLEMFYRPGVAGLFTFDPGLTWPDRNGCSAASYYLTHNSRADLLSRRAADLRGQT